MEERQTFSIDQIITMLEDNKSFISPGNMKRLSDLVGKQTSSPQIKSGDLDLLAEARELHDLVRTMRNTLTSEGGDVSEITKLVSASSTLYGLITKYQQDHLNMDRIRKIELATIEAVKTLDAEAQSIFFGELERLLK